MARTMKRTTVGFGWMLALLSLAPDGARAPDVGTSYRVPYRATDTNHALIRVRINGKGPFNFLVDTGAPLLYVSTEAAARIGLETAPGRFYADVERLDIEGGPFLADIKARIEDPFQLVGMNALGLPGASIDGILGFAILARFRMEMDPTRDRMTWTRLDFEPKDLDIPAAAKDRAPPPEVQAMSALGPLMKFAAVFIGKKPEERLRPRGSLGMELAESDGGVRVAGVLPGSPAEAAGLRAGDRLVRILGHDIDGLKAAREAVAKVEAGRAVPIDVRRGDETLTLTVTAGEGL